MAKSAPSSSVEPRKPDPAAPIPCGVILEELESPTPDFRRRHVRWRGTDYVLSVKRSEPFGFMKNFAPPQVVIYPADVEGKVLEDAPPTLLSNPELLEELRLIGLSIARFQ